MAESDKERIDAALRYLETPRGLRGVRMDWKSVKYNASLFNKGVKK
jgi:hypothetical protein